MPPKKKKSKPTYKFTHAQILRKAWDTWDKTMATSKPELSHKNLLTAMSAFYASKGIKLPTFIEKATKPNKKLTIKDLKVGDRVKALKNTRYEVTKNGWIGEVTSIDKKMGKFTVVGPWLSSSGPGVGEARVLPEYFEIIEEEKEPEVAPLPPKRVISSIDRLLKRIKRTP